MKDFDYNQYKALVEAHIKVDFRGQRGTRRYSGIARVTISYLITSVMMSAFLYNRTDVFTFSFLMISTAMMMTAFSVITGYDTLVGSAAESDILGHHPVASRTCFLAKITNVLFHVLLIGIPLSVPPAIVMLFMFDGNVLLSISFIAVALLSLLFTVSVVVALYSLVIDKIPQQRLKNIIIYFQIAFVFVVIIGYQVVPYMTRAHAFGISLVEEKWLYALPPSWFASLMYLFTVSVERINIPLSLLAVASLFIMLYVMMRILSQRYIRLAEKLLSSDKDAEQVTVRSSNRFFESMKTLLLPDREERAGFDLMATYIKRDRSSRMRVLPGITMPIAIILFGIFTDQLPDPFLYGIFTGVSSVHFTVLFVTLFTAVFMLGSLKFSPHYDAVWIYAASPLVARGRFARGTRKAIIFLVIVPTFFLVLLLFWIGARIMFFHAALHTLFLFASGWVAFTVFSLFESGMPLSKKDDKFETSSRSVRLFLSIPLFIVLTVIQYFAYQNEYFTLIALIVLSVIIEVGDDIGVRILSWRFRQEES